MPTYSYQCDNCSHEFDEIQGFNDPNLSLCPACQQESLLRIYRPAQIVFKGAGYYVNDSRGKKATMKNPKSESNGSSEKSDNKKESKPEAKDSSKKSGKESDKKSSKKSVNSSASD